MERKFKIQLSDTIQQINKIYFIVGLWKTKKNGIAVLSQFFWFMLISTFTLSVLIESYITDDKEECLFLTVTTLIGMLQAYRLHYVIWKQNKIVELMRAISANSTDDYEISCIAEKKLKALMTFSKYSVIISFSLFVCVAILPLVKGKLLFNILFPLDYKTNIIGFWLAYAYVAMAFLLSITCILFFVIMTWYMMLNFVVKYEILGNDFKNLGINRTEVKQGTRLLFVRHLIEAMKNMEHINELLSDCGSMFSSLFLLQVFTSSTCICGAVVTLAFSSHENKVRDGFYFVVLCFCFFDTFTVMYLGNEIQLSFGKLSYCLFESNWTEQTQSCKKCVIILAERLKQSRILVVGKLFPMNLQTFGIIVNRAYSTFNVMQNFRK